VHGRLGRRPCRHGHGRRGGRRAEGHATATTAATAAAAAAGLLTELLVELARQHLVAALGEHAHLVDSRQHALRFGCLDQVEARLVIPDVDDRNK
jgi:hypothetical protein